MGHTDKRTRGLALIREWIRSQPAGRTLQTDAAIRRDMRSLIEWFRAEFDVPGIRYFEIRFHDDQRTRLYVTRRGTELNPRDLPGKTTVSALKRHEYLDRQLAWGGQEESEQ